MYDSLNIYLSKNSRIFPQTMKVSDTLIMGQKRVVWGGNIFWKTLVDYQIRIMYEEFKKWKDVHNHSRYSSVRVSSFKRLQNGKGGIRKWLNMKTYLFQRKVYRSAEFLNWVVICGNKFPDGLGLYFPLSQNFQHSYRRIRGYLFCGIIYT